MGKVLLRIRRYLQGLYERNAKALEYGTILTVLLLVAQCQGNQIANKGYALSITPRLSIATDFRAARVLGPSGGRKDDVVCIPVTIYNNSNAYALNIDLEILMLFANGQPPLSLNQFQIETNQPTTRISRLEPGKKWESHPDELCLSAASNAAEVYRQGTQQCRIEINLDWEDTQRREHRLVHFAELKYAEPTENTGGYFWFQPVVLYDTMSGFLNWWQINRHWGLSIYWPQNELSQTLPKPPSPDSAA
jgi:hypothetical protein